MQHTEKYNFNLPDGTDNVNIADINDNFTKIDGYLNEQQTSITELNRQVAVDGAGTLAFTVADNTTRINELEETVGNLGTGSGTTPVLYIKNQSYQTVDGITWYIEKWNNGYARCWGEYVSDTLEFSETLYGENYAWINIDLPTELFTQTPEYASVTINTGGYGFCVVNVVQLKDDVLTITINRVDNEPTTAIENVHFYIEVRGDTALG